MTSERAPWCPKVSDYSVFVCFVYDSRQHKEIRKRFLITGFQPRGKRGCARTRKTTFLIDPKILLHRTMSPQTCRGSWRACHLKINWASFQWGFYDLEQNSLNISCNSPELAETQEDFYTKHVETISYMNKTRNTVASS